MGSMGPGVLSAKERNILMFDSLPSTLPAAILPQDVDLEAVAKVGVATLAAFKREDLAPNVIWRDLCALTGTFRTFYGPDQVWTVWKKLSQTRQPIGFVDVPGGAEIVRVGKNSSWVLVPYRFETQSFPPLQCSGYIGLVPDPASGKWKVWMLTTLGDQLKGYQSPDKLSEDSISKRWVNDKDDENFDAIVVGAGYSGLAVAGRLQNVGAKVIILESSPDVADNWKNRYHSARFHTTREFSDFPLKRMFTPGDPKFPGRLDLIRCYEKYVDFHQLDIQCSSTVSRATYDTQTKLWTVAIEKDGQTNQKRAKHLVLAIGGLGSLPNMPKLWNRELFKGEVLHSIDYRSADAWKDKVAVIVGSANTAHDVAEDMVDAGLKSVTLVQRSPTPVFPLPWYQALMDSGYTMTTDVEAKDRRTISLPVAISRKINMSYYQTHMAEDPEMLDSLERAGFAVDRSGDMVKCFLGDGAGGHHTDVGGGTRVLAGTVKVKSYANPTHYTPTGLGFADGSHLNADVIVFCTGFSTNMVPSTVKILGPEVASRLGSFWGIDEEGELRGAFKRLDHPAIWLAGGGVPWARFGSHFLALQVQADLLGCPVPQFTDLPYQIESMSDNGVDGVSR